MSADAGSSSAVAAGLAGGRALGELIASVRFDDNFYKVGEPAAMTHT